MYRIFNFYRIFFGALCLLISSSCSEKVNTNDLIPQASPSITDRRASLRSLMWSHAQNIKNAKDGIQNKKKNIDDNFNELLRVNLYDQQLIIADVSKQYDAFINGCADIITDINDANIAEEKNQMSSIIIYFNAENNKWQKEPDALALSGEINLLHEIALDDAHEINEIMEEINSYKELINKKIIDASKHIRNHFGNKKSDLTDVMSKISLSSSFRDLNNVLDDKRFYSLREDLLSMSPNGSKIYENLNLLKAILYGDKEHMSIFELSNQTKNELFGALDLPIKSHEDIIWQARMFDRLFQNNDNKFENLIRQTKFKPAHEIKKSALHNLFVAPPILAHSLIVGASLESAPPPPPVISADLIVINPEKILDDIIINIDEISQNNINQFHTKLKNTLNPLIKFYHQDKLATLKNDLDNIKNGKNNRADYQMLMAQINSYTIDNVKKILIQNDLIQNNNDAIFKENFLRLSKMLSKRVINLLEKKYQQSVSARMMVLHESISKNHTVKILDEKMQAIQKSHDLMVILETCKEINNLSLLSYKMSCQDVLEAIDQIKEIDVTAYLKKIGAIKINLTDRYLNPRETLNSSADKTQFYAALENLNTVIANEHRIDKHSLSNACDYSLNNIVQSMVDVLKEKNLSLYRGYGSYESVVLSYLNELVPHMNSNDISVIGDKIATKNKHQLGHDLRQILSEYSYGELVGHFISSKDSQIEAMKLRVFQEIDELRKALVAIDLSVDEQVIDDSLLHLASFFKDGFAKKISQIKQLTSKDLNPEQQKQQLYEKIDSTDVLKILKYASNFDQKSIDSMPLIKNDVQAVFSDFIEIFPDSVKHKFSAAKNLSTIFKNLQELIQESISHMLGEISQENSVVLRDNKNISPILNSFVMVFGQSLEDLYNALKAGQDDHVITQIADRMRTSIFSSYIKNFEKISSVVGQDTSDTLPKEHYLQIEKLKSLKEMLDSRISPKDDVSFLSGVLAKFLQ